MTGGLAPRHDAVPHVAAPHAAWRGAVGIGTALLVTLLLLGWATEGFAVLTTDGARARAVRRAPVAVPAVATRDAQGVVQPVLHDTFAPDGGPRATIVDFVYTRCITLCGVLGGVYQRLQQDISARGLEDRVRLLTVSFDLEHDGPAQLAMHARVMGARSALWSLATPVTPAGRDRLLQTFGVQVVPDGNNGWVHNAALHVVDPAGRLVRIFDIANRAGAIDAAEHAWLDAQPRQAP